jgi:hypothetical protein
MYKAQKITNRAAWFRSIRPGIVSKGKFEERKDLKTISVQLADFNACYGEKLDVYVHAKYISKELSVILVGVTYKQRLKELKNPKYKDEWRNLIKE